MSTTTCGLVLTTINDSDILDGYRDNFERAGVLDRVRAYLIPDRKTPAAVGQRCDEMRRRGLRIACPTIAEQESFLSRLGPLARLIPYDSDNRRNIGYLMALEEGSDFVISIDDDNFCRPQENFFAEHSVVCEPEHPETVVDADTGWFNVCEMLEMNPRIPVYPRGFPYRRRHIDLGVSTSEESVVIRINAGLWLGEPDLDAMTWLVSPVRATALSGGSLALGANSWSPINTQNTAVAREVVWSYYFALMGSDIGGFRIDRYGDIISGMFALACARHFGHRARFGSPLALHHRNSHNYLRDAGKEYACIVLLEDVTAWLEAVKLEGSTYGEAYLSLADQLDEAVELVFSGGMWPVARGYIHQLTYCMREWVKACSLVG